MVDWKPPIPLNGHIFSYGRTGSGKSWKLLAIIQFYFEQGYKIWDIYGGKRREGSFWCFPSEEDKLWFDYKQMVGTMKEDGPKEYNVNLYYPFLKTHLPENRQIPEKLPRIKSKVFTIYWKSLTINHIAVVSGTVTPNQKALWEKLKSELSDFTGSADLLDWFERSENVGKKTNPLYKSFLLPVCSEGLLQGKNCKYNIDLIEEAKEKDRIFVLNEDYTSADINLFLISYISSTLFELVNDEDIHNKNLLFFREMNLFMKVQDESSQDSDQRKIIRNQISDVARYGRSGLFIAGDTQSPAEVRGLVEGQDDLLCLNELPGIRDREEACDRIRADGRMSTKQVAYLGTLPIQEMIIVERGKSAKLIKRVQPPRTMGWKREIGSFQKVWKNKYNSYRDIRNVIDDINTEDYKKEIVDDYVKPVTEEDLNRDIHFDKRIESETVDESEDERLRLLKNQYKELKNQEIDF